MKCPFCSSLDTQVLDTRLSDNNETIKRRRKCAQCSKKFNTIERLELLMPSVIKKNLNRNEFDIGKVRASFDKALHKRNVATEDIDTAVERVKQAILLLGQREIDTEVIGDLVMDELAVLDKVAYIRYASVYRSFDDVIDFIQAAKTINS